MESQSEMWHACCFAGDVRASDVDVDASDFDGNLTTTDDNTVQKIVGEVRRLHVIRVAELATRRF